MGPSYINNQYPNAQYTMPNAQFSFVTFHQKPLNIEN
jgi:hypothetical protein